MDTIGNVYAWPSIKSDLVTDIINDGLPTTTTPTIIGPSISALVPMQLLLLLGSHSQGNIVHVPSSSAHTHLVRMRINGLGCCWARCESQYLMICSFIIPNLGNGTGAKERCLNRTTDYANSHDCTARNVGGRVYTVGNWRR